MSEAKKRDHRLLTEIRLDNLLSFGPGSPALPLEALNVLIGPNGSGKSNLIEAVALMRATHADLQKVLRQGGGSAEWIWKGARRDRAAVEFVVKQRDVLKRPKHNVRHLLEFVANAGARFALANEQIESITLDGSQSRIIFGYGQENPVVEQPQNGRYLELETFNFGRSVLAQLRDPQTYPDISFLQDVYERIRVYRDWTFGRDSVFRQPQRADMRNDRLEEDFSNLGLFINRLRREPQAKAAVLDGLRDLYNDFTDFDVIVEGGSVQVFFTEGQFTIPATRLSDGTLRYLCLLAILFDPSPPPLICIEEPELGLHPDILPKLADHLAAASQRTQIIVTTHSDILVDAMTERPEAVVICEKHEGRTQMQRLNRDDLAAWLEKYRLGQLWTKGQLGGTRW